MNELDNQSFKKPKFNQRDEDQKSKSESSPNCKDKRDNPRNNPRKYSGNQRRNNRKREYKVPEHVKNPSKFKKYDLSDVKLTDGKVSYLQSYAYDSHCSEILPSFFVQKRPFLERKQNSAAALSFLAELKDRKREPEEKSFDPDNDKIQFNRPKQNKTKQNVGNNLSKTKVGGGILLDEYVVGMAKPRVSKTRSNGEF